MAVRVRVMDEGMTKSSRAFVLLRATPDSKFVADTSRESLSLTGVGVTPVSKKG